MKTPLRKQQIETLIPHSGTMCLLDEVISWDKTKIVCLSVSHLDPNNPLLVEGHLPPLHLLEYGSQAIAIHGGLFSHDQGLPIKTGFLAAIRDAKFYQTSRAVSHKHLVIRAEAIMQTQSGVVYQFRIFGNQEQVLIEAKATVMYPS